MPLVILGTLLLVAKLAELGPFANLAWWWVLAPFGLAVLWWEFADSSGWTQRRAMNKMDERKRERRDAAMQALGLDHRRERLATRSRRDAARRTSGDEPKVNAGAGAPAPAAESRRDPRQ
ncbi:MAG: TIGR04438 family Trp-rich protein [Burkholderiales bacterium]|nr:TIGR04438 family Trp-rich protein [Burkholderiales bacterium]